MDLQAEKLELIKLLLETRKVSIIKKMKALLKEQSENEGFELLDSHKEELDKRLSRMKKGATKFYTWEQVEQKLKEAL